MWLGLCKGDAVSFDVLKVEKLPNFVEACQKYGKRALPSYTTHRNKAQEFNVEAGALTLHKIYFFLSPRESWPVHELLGKGVAVFELGGVLANEPAGDIKRPSSPGEGARKRSPDPALAGQPPHQRFRLADKPEWGDAVDLTPEKVALAKAKLAALKKPSKLSSRQLAKYMAPVAAANGAFATLARGDRTAAMLLAQDILNGVV